MASNSSDLERLGPRLAAILRRAQWAAIALVVVGLALEFASPIGALLEVAGVAVLVASPFLATAVIASTAGRSSRRLLGFAVATLVLAALGIVLAV